ncbi:MAG: hypothetical protein WD052_12600, partial [Bacteroidales bacterium]
MSVVGKFRHRIILLSLGIATVGTAYGQEVVDYDEMLQRVDTIENPVYKPVISVGYGALNFYGDVNSGYRLPAAGDPGVRFNVTSYIDNKQYFAANFFIMTGTLRGSQRSVTDLSRNLNFSSSIINIGASARYAFGHFLSSEMKFRPYISFGVEQINFDTKGDLEDSNGFLYHYWPDGTIRSIPETGQGTALPLVRDYMYETDMRSYERNNYGLGQYNPRSFGIPFEIGITWEISQRIFVSLGTEYHYTFTDYIDNVAAEGTYIQGNKANDGFLFTHLTLHLDLFSEPKIRTVDLLFIEMKLDPVFFDDEDGDFVLDVVDHCPGTPYGVVTDSLGCPLDSDNDGIPDYLDKEQDTRAGAWVDDDGVTISEDDFMLTLQRDKALSREDLETYLSSIESKFRQRSVSDIPEKFAQIDGDG